MKELAQEDKTLPISFEKFIAAYHTNSNTEDSAAGYYIYLKENEFMHTYGEYANRHEWMQAEVTAYLTK